MEGPILLGVPCGSHPLPWIGGSGDTRAGRSSPSILLQDAVTLLRCFGGHAVDGSGAVTLPGRKPGEIGVCRGRSQMGTAGRGGTLCWSPCFQRYAIVCRGGVRNGVRFPARVGKRLAGSQDENREAKGAGIRAGKKQLKGSKSLRTSHLPSPGPSPPGQEVC